MYTDYSTRYYLNSPDTKIAVNNSINMYDVRVLTCDDQINEARHLLYKIYTEEGTMRSSFAKAINLETKTYNNKHIFIDDNDNHSIWVAAFDNGKIIGTGRLNFKETLEVSKYTNLRDVSGRCEIGRLTIMKEYRRSTLVYKIILLLCDIARAMRLKILCYSCSASVMNVTNNIIGSSPILTNEIDGKYYSLSSIDPVVAVEKLTLFLSRSKL